MGEAQRMPKSVSDLDTRFGLNLTVKSMHRQAAPARHCLGSPLAQVWLFLLPLQNVWGFGGFQLLGVPCFNVKAKVEALVSLSDVVIPARTVTSWTLFCVYSIIFSSGGGGVILTKTESRAPSRPAPSSVSGLCAQAVSCVCVTQRMSTKGWRVSQRESPCTCQGLLAE